jgi:hypothetical protein
LKRDFAVGQKVEVQNLRDVENKPVSADVFAKKKVVSLLFY